MPVRNDVDVRNDRYLGLDASFKSAPSVVTVNAASSLPQDSFTFSGLPAASFSKTRTVFSPGPVWNSLSTSPGDSLYAFPFNARPFTTRTSWITTTEAVSLRIVIQPAEAGAATNARTTADRSAGLNMTGTRCGTGLSERGFAVPRAGKPALPMSKRNSGRDLRRA